MEYMVSWQGVGVRCYKGEQDPDKRPWDEPADFFPHPARQRADFLKNDAKILFSHSTLLQLFVGRNGLDDEEVFLLLPELIPKAPTVFFPLTAYRNSSATL